MKSVVKALLGLSMLSMAGLAQANSITFEGLGLPNFGDIPANHKDHDGDTANIGVAYRTISPAGAVLNNHLDFWSTGYGDLLNVAYAVSNGNYAEIIFTPDPGWAVALLSFELAGYFNADRTAEVLVKSGSSMIDYTGLVQGAFDGGPRHSTYTPNLISGQTLTLRWGRDWNVAIDNIAFRQIDCEQVPGACPAETPEPNSLAALALGLLGLAAARPRKR